MKSRLWLAALLAGSALISACDQKPAAEKPAAVKNAVPETDLATITLSPEAVKRLGIETVPVADASGAQSRFQGGEIQLRPGQSVAMSAPGAGIIVPLPGRDFPVPGTKLKRGQPLIGFVPTQVTSEFSGSGEDVRVRQAEYDAARRRTERIRALVPEKGASPEDLDIAESDLARADARLQVALTQRDYTRNDTTGDARARAAIMTIGAPSDGVLQSIAVANGQNVAPGQALLTVQGQGPMWVRLQVFSGQLADLDLNAPAYVRALDGESEVEAHAVSGPPTATAASAAADLYYEFDNKGGRLRPGERVLVRLPFRTQAKTLTVPHSAVFHDINGSTWIYENTAPNVYVRKRVILDHIAGNTAVLVRGPIAGTKVVSVGVAELAGTEFGVGK